MRINLRRMLLIARQDFMGYIKTWGFWLTALGPFIGLIIAAIIPFVMMNSEPVRLVSILDETGNHASQIEQFYKDDNQEILKLAVEKIAKFTIPREKRGEFERVLAEEGVEAAKEMIRKTSPQIASHIELPENKLKFVPPPAKSLAEIEPYLLGEKTLTIDGKPVKLDGVLYIMVNDRQLELQYWTTNASRNQLASLADRYFSRLNKKTWLADHGVDYEKYQNSWKKAPKVVTLNPQKKAGEESSQEITFKDKIPYLVAAAMSVLLWLTVFNGAYMLLMSMVEEKTNKVLEMLLACTRFSEIFFGKLLGVAALTIATLLPWLIIGTIGFYGASMFADNSIVEGLAKAVSVKMLVFLPIFFLLGYLFYGSIFVAMGALSESMQDASTLMTPIVLVLSACIIVVPIGISFPDSPLLIIAAWIPFSAPFAAVIRLAGDAPLWESIGSVMVLIAACIFVVWGSARLFQHGVLAGNGMAGLKTAIWRIVPWSKKG